MMRWPARLQVRTKRLARAAEAVLLLEVASALVRLWPRRASAVLVRTFSADVDARAEPELSSEIVHLVERAERLVPRTTCLSRAVASCAMLRRRGIRARIRVGARRDHKGGICAHAWLECGELKDGGDPTTEFAVLSRVA